MCFAFLAGGRPLAVTSIKKSEIKQNLHTRPLRCPCILIIPKRHIPYLVYKSEDKLLVIQSMSTSEYDVIIGVAQFT